MTKRIESRHRVLPEIAERWSPRSFADRSPDPEALRSMFEAARQAPSAHNTQPARFVLARRERREDYRRLFDCLSEGNREWAHTAPVLVLASAMKRRLRQVDSTWVPYPHAMHDLGLAVMSFILQGQALGLHSHPMAGFDPDKAREAFAIPELYEPGVMIAVGHVGSPDALSEPLRVRELAPRTPRPLEENVYEGVWGRTSPLLAEPAPCPRP